MTLILKHIRARFSTRCPGCGRPIRITEHAGFSADLPGRLRCWTCVEHLIDEHGMQAYDGGLYVAPKEVAP